MAKQAKARRLTGAEAMAKVTTLRTSPRKLISPVIDVSLLTGRCVSSDVSARNMATPAEGPSLGIPPAGMWTWRSLFSKKSRGMPYFSAFVRT